ncbi:MAG TPA: hypothetical protein VJT32_05840 [bacterium]|nr:hypothetical protein [bacterium]
MNRRDLLALFLVGLIGVAGLWEFRFVLHEDSAGRVYRMDRLSGTIVRLSDILPPPLPRSLPSRALHSWDKIQLVVHGDVSLALATKWQEGKLSYHLSVEPATKSVESARSNQALSSYTVIFQDADHFPVAKADVLLSHMVRMTDDKGQVSGLEAWGQIPMTMQAYDTIVGWNVEWNFAHR